MGELKKCFTMFARSPAATTDQYSRAFDLSTGKELWSDRLAAVGQATPMTYMGS
jgi:glucose dehydrogenase